jgi:hypothetical protein
MYLETTLELFTVSLVPFNDTVMDGGAVWDLLVADEGVDCHYHLPEPFGLNNIHGLRIWSERDNMMIKQRTRSSVISHVTIESMDPSRLKGAGSIGTP